MSKELNTSSDYDLLFNQINNLLKIHQDLNHGKIENENIESLVIGSYQSVYVDHCLELFLRKFTNLRLSIILRKLLTKYLFILILFQTVSSIFKYGCTLLLDNVYEILKFLDPHSQDQWNVKIIQIIVYLVGIIVFNLIYGITDIQALWHVERNKQYINIVLRALIFKKVLKTYSRGSSKKQQSSKKGFEDEIDLNNVMTVDIEQCQFLMVVVQKFTASVVELIFCFSLIYYKVGNSAIIPILFLVLIGIISSLIVTNYKKIFLRIVKQRDQRISLMTDILMGIRSIKCLSWEKIFSHKLMQIRAIEYTSYQLGRVINVSTEILWQIAPYVTILLILQQYLAKQSFSSTNIFTLITLVRQIIAPISVIPWLYMAVINGGISLRRIGKILAETEIDSSHIFQQQNHQTEQESAIIIPESIEATFPKQENKKKKNKNVKSILSNHQGSIELEQHFKLKIPHLTIQKNSLVFLIGELGSGKSAFINYILNEMKLHQNVTFNLQEKNNNKIKLEIYGSIAYVAQNTWLRSESIKDNILFGKQFKKEWYDECVSACQMEQDIKVAPNKDNYNCGPGGQNLSGGQRQRLALCRAVYLDADIYLLDDPLSSLDVHVADAIMQQVVQDLLIKRGKTVIMATSHYKFLNQADKIILMMDGEVIQDKQKIDNYTAIERISLQGDNKKEQESDSEKEEEEEKDLEHQNSVVIKNEIKSSQKEAENQVKAEVEQREEGKIKLDTYLLYMKAMGILTSIVYIIFNYGLQALKTFIDFWLKNQISVDSQKTFNKQEFLQSLLILIGATAIGSTILQLLYFRWSTVQGQNLFVWLTQKVLYSKMVFFDKNTFGRIISRFAQDIGFIHDELTWLVQGLALNSAIMIGYIVGIVIQIPYAAISLPFAFLLINSSQAKYRRTLRELKRLDAINTSFIMNHITETLTGVTTLRAFTKQNYFVKEFIKKLAPKINSLLIIEALGSWARIKLFISTFFIFVVVIIFNIILIVFKLIDDYNNIGLSLTFTLLLSSSVSPFMFFLAQTQNNFICIERVNDYLQNETEDLTSKPSNQLQLMHEDALDIEPDDYIVFKNVKLSYDQSDNPNKKYALNGVSFKVKKGEKIAFCGRTGSGKTSVLNALYNLYKKESGSIFIRGVEIDSLSLQQLRKQMSLIPQFGFLFEGTFKENVDPEQKLNEKQLQQIVESSGLAVRGVNKQREQESKNQEENQQITINKTENINVNFEIQKSGRNLSNGEKQVINFLRILVQDTEIVCLDEATSNMDPETDKNLNDKLFEYTQDKALLVITHRLEQIHLYDRIYVMETGKIIESGHYNELKENPSSFFRNVLLNKS